MFAIELIKTHMKKADLEQLVKDQKTVITNLENGIDALVEESLMLGEDMRGRPFLPEDIEGFTTTEIMNKYKTHVEREIYSMDNFHLSRGKDSIWFIITSANDKIPVEINDMFEGITVLRALGLKKLSFQGLAEADELVVSMADELREVRVMRDERVAEEARESNETPENEK